MSDTTGIQVGPNKEFMDRLIGRDNISQICINGTKTVGLIDTGSMISTIAEDFIISLDPIPDLYTIEDLGLKGQCCKWTNLELLRLRCGSSVCSLFRGSHYAGALFSCPHDRVQ